MALDTYANLQTAVASMLHRTDLTAAIPDWITLFEAYARAEIQTPEMETGTGTVTITAGASFGALPTDFLEMRAVTVTVSGSIVTLDVLTPKVMKERYPYQGAGTPRAVSIIGTNLYVDRPTDTAYSIDLDYWAAIPALSTTNPTNWLLTKYPNAYLYGTLVQGAPWVGADARIPVWQGFLDRAINGINIRGMLQGNGSPVVAQFDANYP